MPETLPEGTDHIVPGAANTSRRDPTDAGSKAGAGASDAKPAAAGKTGSSADTDSKPAASGKADDSSATNDTPAGDAKEPVRLSAGDLRERAQAKAEELRAQAGDSAREIVEQGKERASGALDDLAKMIEDAADQIDDKLGGHYGDYARRAAGLVSDTAGSLRDREVEDLLDDARALVRRSPGLAIGGAAAVGFVLARILKSGSEVLEEAAAGLNASSAKA